MNQLTNLTPIETKYQKALDKFNQTKNNIVLLNVEEIRGFNNPALVDYYMPDSIQLMERIVECGNAKKELADLRGAVDEEQVAVVLKENALNVTISGLRLNLEQANQRIADETNVISTLKKELTAETERKNRADEEIHQKRLKINDLENQVAELTKSQATAKSTSQVGGNGQSDLEKAKKELESSKKTVKTLEETIETLEKRIKTHTEKIGKLNDELKEKDIVQRKKIGEYDAKIKELNSGMAKKEDVIYEKEKDLKKRKTEYDQLVIESNQYKEKIENLTEDLKENQTSMQTLKNKLKVPQDDIQKRDDEIEQKKKELERKQEEIDTLISEGNGYKDKIEKLVEEAEETNTSHKRHMRYLVGALITLIIGLGLHILYPQLPADISTLASTLYQQYAV